ncbi:MAG: hypothetical protein SFW36_01730 [Leptolyngbyaceae cyanobacterium bins.59]|nr:hypothetical protein [Leptolyngbyaceae cyanobacterium bins.59]
MRVSALAALTLMALATQDGNQKATASQVSDNLESFLETDQQPDRKRSEVRVAAANTSPPELIPALEASTIVQPVAFELKTGSDRPSPRSLKPLEGVANVPTRIGPETASIPEFFHEIEPGYRLPKQPLKSAQELPSATLTFVPMMLIQPTNAVPSPQKSQAVSIPVIPPKPARTIAPRRAVRSLPPPEVRSGSSSNRPAFALPVDLLAQRPTRGISRRLMRLQSSIIATVTNRTSRAIEIELVGQTRPLVLLPGQTRVVRGGSRDFSLLYWVSDRPNRPSQALAAQVAQIGPRQLLVDIFGSRFPNDNQAIYYPEPGRADVLKIF